MATDPVRTASMEPALSGAHLLVREMELSEVGIRIDYFHDATDEHLRTLGVDRALLPSRTAWRRFYETDYARPVSSGRTTPWCGTEPGVAASGIQVRVHPGDGAELDQLPAAHHALVPGGS